MGNKLTKKQRAQRSKKKTAQRVKKLEKQDSLGINRKEIKNGLNPKVWVIMKIISIVIVPIIYFVYSPFLILAMTFSVMMFGFTSMAEKHINHTYVKSRHIKIHKFDSIIAVLVIIITFTSALISANTKKQTPFNKMGNSVLRTIENIGSCSTGSRSSIKSFSKDFKAPSFGGTKPPEGMPPMGPGGFKGDFKKLEVSDLPIEMVFSMAVSSVNTVLVFMVPACGCLTLFLYYRRKKKFDKDMNEIVIDALPVLTDEEFAKIFSFSLDELIVDDSTSDDALDLPLTEGTTKLKENDLDNN